MRTDTIGLSGVLAEIARVTSAKTALIISREHGGTRLYIPRDPGPDHPLSKLVGHPEALAIGKALSGGEALEIPLGPFQSSTARWRHLNRMLDGNMTSPQIARALGVHQRTVRRHRNGHTKVVARALAQGELF